MKSIPELLREKGLVPGTKSYRREYERIRWSRRSAKSKAKCGRPTAKKSKTKKGRKK